MRIELLDPADTPTVDRVVDLWQTAYEVDNPDFPPFCPRWERGRIDHPSPDEPSEFWLAWDEDGLAGVADLSLPTLDNLTAGTADIVVRPSTRRRGVGTALVTAVRDRMQALGRKELVLWGRLGGPASGFAASVGARTGLVEVRRRLVVEPGTVEACRALNVAALPHTAGYSVVRWQGDTPEEYVDGIAYLTGRMSTDAPMEELDWEPEMYDAARVRAREAAFGARGRRMYTSAAVHKATGALAGFTELFFDSCVPTNAWQWNTLVDPAHRGHRLGTVLKVANLLFALEHEPALRTVETWNAGSNDHMIAINEAMGFRPLDSWGNWQLDL